MKHFVKALYADLLHRIDFVVEDIKGLDHHEDIKDRFIDDTLAQFSAIRIELMSAFKTGVLEFDVMAGNNLHRFNNAHRQFKAIHSYRYLAIKNYKAPEIFFYRLISKVYKEHRISAIPPIVSTISNHDYYYWAVPYFEIIALPCGEENSLLNLPDIYHEIGHLLHSMFKGKSCELSVGVVDKHFEKEVVRVEDEGLPNRYKVLLEKVKHLWQASWIEEFTCDLVGTYMTGPAYAWTNLKLLSTGHGSIKIYEFSNSHPANEARMRIIIIMLEKLGMKAEKELVEKAWSVFLSETEGFKPAEYSLLYPQKLLEQIVNEFFDFYQNADLASYPELLASGKDSIAKILNEAWDNAQADPAGYFKHESDVINKMKADFGIK
jgi:hypothetical protein